ncbi:hypothetical protein T484DRAFT_1935015 [Baffinella frigidus]|nr:hypothetical protein T484DRAFT_1935015 [Cryptophyta sp. CCMP2293]
MERIVPLSGVTVGIVGASIGGLSCARALLDLGATVRVVERYPRGFSTRGSAISADEKLLLEITHHNEPPPRLEGGGAYFYGDLWAYLHSSLPPDTVRFGIEISEILDAGTLKPALMVHGEREEFDLILCADGGWSHLRKYVTNMQPRYAGYVLWRGRCDLVHAPGFKSWGAFRNGNVTTTAYAVRGPPPSQKCRSGVYLQMGVYIAQPEAEITRPTRGANCRVTVQRAKAPSWFLPLMEKLFVHEAGGDLVRRWRKIVKDDLCEAHPVFELVCERVVAGQVVLVGDAAHLSSPNTSAGGHTAMLDAFFLRETLRRTITLHDGGGLDEALGAYNEVYPLSSQAVEFDCKRYVPDPSHIESPSHLLARLAKGGDVNLSPVREQSSPVRAISSPVQALSSLVRVLSLP